MQNSAPYPVGDILCATCVSKDNGKHRMMYPDALDDVSIDKCRLVVTQLKGLLNRFRSSFLISDFGLQLNPREIVLTVSAYAKFFFNKISGRCERTRHFHFYEENELKKPYY